MNVLSLHMNPGFATMAAASRVVQVARYAPAVVGDTLAKVSTPALCVDVDAVRRNIARAVVIAKATPGVEIRPHIKSCKSADLAKLMIAEGGGLITGVCCQKVVEAEAMAWNGVSDVFLANQVIGQDKVDRFVALSSPPHNARLSIVVDSTLGLAQLQTAAAAAGTVVGVLVEMDVGQARCGVPDPAAAVALAQAVGAHANLRFIGLQAYHGAAQHIRGWGEREAVVQGVVAKAQEAVQGFLDAGLVGEGGVLPPFTPPAGVPAPTGPAAADTLIVTGGGTGTWPLEAASGLFTEVQPGSFIFNDADYARNGMPSGDGAAAAAVRAGAEGVPVSDPAGLLGPPAEGVVGEGGQEWGQVWEHSLFLLATVMSRNTAGGYAVLDAGMKSTSVDSGQPVLASGVAAARGGGEATGVRFGVTTDEHSTIVLGPEQGPAEAEGALPALGTKLLLVPGHCDPTVNLHDFIVAFSPGGEGEEGAPPGEVKGVWTVQARSAGY